MKSSLEDERRALLEQIEASRAVYRRMLSGEPVSDLSPSGAAHRRLHGSAPAHAYSSASVMDTRASNFAAIRNRSAQWVRAHPLWMAGGVALLVLLAPRIIGGRARAARQRRARDRTASADNEMLARQSRSSGTLRALLTVTALLLRDPARLRAMASVAGSAWQWLQRRRHARLAAVLQPSFKEK